jgi:hypothetical protein
MILKDFIREALERKYLGELIYNSQNSTTFEVYKITVEDGGVDPQWEIGLCSKLCEQVRHEQREWQQKYNPTGGNLPPNNENWRRGNVEYFYMTQATDKMPDIVAPDEDDEEEDNPDLSSCEQCGEKAWDGRICHSCGMKYI